MRGVILAMAAVCGLGAASYGLSRARAATVDTFDFTQVGWDYASNFGGPITAGAPDPGGLLTGSFTGTVEASGLIELSDLTAFSAVYTDTANPGGFEFQDLSTTTLFSYDTVGSASSLDIAGFFNFAEICVGGTVPFDANCTSNFLFAYTPGTNGAVFAPTLVIPVVVTSDRPTITLVSSVTTAPSSTVPEPPSSILLLTALAGMLGLTGWTTRRRHAAIEAVSS
jgi:hypothetical protein